MEQGLRVFRVGADESFWYIAENEKEAREMYYAEQGEDAFPIQAVDAEPDQERCAVIIGEDGRADMRAPSEKEIKDFEGDDWLLGATIKTFGEWARERGRGTLGNTV